MCQCLSDSQRRHILHDRVMSMSLILPLLSLQTSSGGHANFFVQILSNKAVKNNITDGVNIPWQIPALVF